MRQNEAAAHHADEAARKLVNAGETIRRRPPPVNEIRRRDLLGRTMTLAVVVADGIQELLDRAVAHAKRKAEGRS